MNGNDALFFWYFKMAAQWLPNWLVMDSETINGSVVTDETVIAKILNKNQGCHYGKKLTQEK